MVSCPGTRRVRQPRPLAAAAFHIIVARMALLSGALLHIPGRNTNRQSGRCQKQMFVVHEVCMRALQACNLYIPFARGLCRPAIYTFHLRGDFAVLQFVFSTCTGTLQSCNLYFPLARVLCRPAICPFHLRGYFAGLQFVHSTCAGTLQSCNLSIPLARDLSRPAACTCSWCNAKTIFFSVCMPDCNHEIHIHPVFTMLLMAKA